MSLIFGFNVFDKPVEEYFEYAAIHGLKHLEIDLICKHSFLSSFNAKRIHRLQLLSKIYGIRLSLHTPHTINPSENIPMLRRANVSYLKKCVLLAEKLDASHITTHIGFCSAHRGKTTTRQQALERLIAGLKEVLEYCKEHKIKLALENVTPTKHGSDLLFLGDSVEDFRYIFSNLRSRYLRLCLDMGHANVTEGVMAYIQAFGKKIINIHYHDNKGHRDEHLAIGEGTIPWKEAITALKKLDYRGPFISECFRMEPHEAALAIEKIYRPSRSHLR